MNKYFTYLRALILLVLFLVLAQPGKGQSDSLMNDYLNKAKEKIALKDYSSANNYLRQIFALKTTIPDEVAYYYGLTLVKLEHYKKGREALEKYVSLKGKEGTFYNQSQELIAEANTHICQKCQNTGVTEVTDTCIVCHGSGKIFTHCNACNSQGIEFCQVCKGQGTRVVKGKMGDVFSTCKNCNGKGVTNCQVCNGTTKRVEYCSECKGKGFFKRKITCTH